MKHMLLLTLLAVTTCCKPYAQGSKQTPARVKFWDGTVQKGTIAYVVTNQTPVLFRFTDSLQQKRTLTPEQAFEVDIEGKEKYIGVPIVRYLNAVDVADIKDAAQEKETPATTPVFLQELVAGSRASLYMHRDATKTHYFIANHAQDTIVTLRYVVKVDVNTLRAQHIYHFRDQLETLVVGNAEASQYLRAMRWQTDDMIRFVKLVNQDFSLSRFEQQERKRKQQNSVFAGAAAGIVTFDVASRDRLLQNMSFTTAQVLLPYAGVRLSGGRRYERLMLQALVTGWSYRSQGTYRFEKDGQDVTDKLDVEVKSFHVTTELLYRIGAAGSPLQLELGAGLGCNFPTSFSALHTTTERGIDGRILGRDQNLTSRELSVRYQLTAQLQLFKYHTIRCWVMIPKVPNGIGRVGSGEGIYSIGYHFNFKRR